MFCKRTLSPVFLVFFLVTRTMSQGTFTSISSGTGDWDQSSTWTLTSGSDLGGDGLPGNKDHVIIDGGTINLVGVSQAEEITINSGILELNGHQLRLWKNNGSLTNNGTINGTGIIRTITNHIISGSGTYNSNITYSNDYRLTFDTDLTLNNHYVPPTGSVVINNGKVVTISGNFRCNSSSGNYVTNNGTIVIGDPTNFFITYESSQDRLRSLSGNLELNSGGSIPQTEDGGYKNLTLSGITTSNFSYSINGNITNSGSYTSSGSSTVTFNGNSVQFISSSGTSNFETISITNSSGINISDAGHTLNASGVVTNEGNLVVVGIFNSTNSIIFSGSVSEQTISGSGTSNFQDVSITNANGINISDANHTMNCAGTVTSSGNLKNIGIFNSTGTTIFNGSSLQTISGSGTFNFEDLNLNNSNNLSLSSGATITINDELTSSSGSFINEGNIFINTPSSFMSSNSNTNFQSISGNIQLPNGGIIPEPSDGYNDISLNGTSSSNFSFIVNGDFTNSGVSFTSSGSNTITFSGSSSQKIDGSGIKNFERIILNNSNGLSLEGGTINIIDLMQSDDGTITQNGATVILESTADNKAGMIDVSNASADYTYSTGTFTSKRHISGSSAGWRLISSPIKNSTLSEIDNEIMFCGVLNGGLVTGNNYSYADCLDFYSVMTYNTSGSGNVNSVSGNGDFDGVDNITQSISGGAGTLIYWGTDTKDLSMSNVGNRAPEFDNFTISTSSANGGFNLISNPYPCTIDYDQLRSDNALINQTGYYIFSGPGGAGSWTTKDKSIKIPHNQGFMISTSGSSLQFNVSQTTNTQPTFTKSSNGVNKPLKVEIKSTDSLVPSDFSYVHSDQNFSINYDTLFEMPKLFSPNPDYTSSLYFVDNDSNSIERICINNNQSVSLNLDIKTGKYVNGSYTMNFGNISQFMIGSCLTLEDLHNGIITDLRTQDSYSFITDSLAPSPRFKLNINVDYDIIVSNSNCFQDSSASISLSGSSIQGSFFNLLDSNNVVLDSIIANQDSILFSNLNTGIFTISTDHIGSCSMLNQQIIITEPNEVAAGFTSFFDTIYLDSNGIASLYLKNTSYGSSFYIWDFGDGNSSVEINPTHNFTNSGVFNIKLTASNDSLWTCSNTFNDFVVVINPFLNIVDEETESDIDIYYYAGYLNINFLKNQFDDMLINIRDLQGRLTGQRTNPEKENKINLSHLESGIYITEVLNLTNNQSFKYKFFID